ncbi:MAG: hypothetical protein PSV35_06745, partial [bacterium]|nr:hypothetical protein [bacterium]
MPYNNSSATTSPSSGSSSPSLEQAQAVTVLINSVVQQDSADALNTLYDALLNYSEQAINTKYKTAQGTKTLLEVIVDLYCERIHSADQVQVFFAVIERLLKNKANPNVLSVNNTPILLGIVAARINKKEAIEAIRDLLCLFYEYEADFSVKDKAGHNAVQTAINYRNYGLIKLLHQLGCGVNAVNNGYGDRGFETALDLLQSKKGDAAAQEMIPLMESLGAQSWQVLDSSSQ